MTRKRRPTADPGDAELDQALASALLHAGEAGATLLKLTEGLRIGFGLDVSKAQVGRALLGRLLHGTAQKLPGGDWPTYAARYARYQVGQRGKP